MILCVAAQYVHKGQDRVVFAADFSMESGVATAEIERKKTVYICKEEFPVLIAGSGSRARELITYIQEFWNAADNEDIFLAACRLAIQKYKHGLANEYVSARLGISYDDLIGSFHSSIPDDQYRELLADISRMKLGCAVIVSYFDDEESLLVRLEDDGSIEVCSNFSAIGTGMYIAESALFQREHTHSDSLADTIYHVYEAMRLGSHAPGVGKRFAMGIAHIKDSGTVQWEHVQPSYMKLLEKEFKRFGPRKLKRQVLQAQFLRELASSQSETPDPPEAGEKQ